MKTYTIAEIVRKRLLLRPDGEPFTSDEGATKRIKAFGHSPSKLDRRGMLVYSISEKDIKYMNSKYEQRNNQG